MSILKHSNKYLLALFISHVFFVIIIQGAPSGQTNEPGSIPPLTAALSHIHPREWQQISKYGIKQNVSTDNELEEIYQKHRINRSKVIKPLPKAVIVGGGPDGLYAAFQLFKSGIQVVLVNDQKEKHLHNHIVYLKSDCMYELRLFLGPVFNELFKQDGSPGEIEWSRRRWTKKETGKVNLKFLQNALEKRLDSLVKYVSYKEKDLLRVIYKYSVDRIQFPTADNPQYSAVLKSIYSPITTSLPFDLLVCAGGINDKIRDTYLGLPKKLTKPRNYVRAVILKGEKYENENFYCEISDNKMQHLMLMVDKKQTIGDYLGKSPLLSQEIKDEYADIDHQRVCLANRTVRNYQNKYSITFVQATHSRLEKFLKAVENEKNKPENGEKREEYDDFMFNIVKMCYAAIAYELINGGRNKSHWIEINIEKDPKEGMLNFDPDPINTTTSDFIQYALDNAAVQYTVLGKSAIVLAVGDSALNSHFYSRNGFSLAWESIKKAAELIRDYNSFGEFVDVVSEWNEKFKEVKEKVFFTSKNYAEFMEEPEEIKRIAWNAMSLAVNDMINQDTTQANYGFKITRSHLHPLDFMVEFDGNKYSVRISIKDAKIHVKTKKFDTIVQAAMWLKEENRKKKEK